MGLALRDPGGSVDLAIRRDPARGAALSGFDPIALAVPARADVQAWLVRRLPTRPRRQRGLCHRRGMVPGDVFRARARKAQGSKVSPAAR